MIVIKTLEGTHRVGSGVVNPTLFPAAKWTLVKVDGRSFSVKVREYAAPSTPRGKRRVAKRGK